MPPNIRDFLQNRHCLVADTSQYLSADTLSNEDTVTVLSEYLVSARIKSSKKPNSWVKGDVPPKLMRKFYVEFASPATKIFNSIIKNGVYPDQWKVEHGIPIPKQNSSPKDENEIRIISKTNFLSKIF